MLLRHKLKNLKGFTLIELLVVIAIIGILASVVLSSMASARQSAINVRKKTELRTVINALQVYYWDNNSVPGNRIQGSWDVFGPNGDNTLTELITGGYLNTLPTSPDSLPYYYYDYGSYVIVSTRLEPREHGPWPTGWRCSGQAVDKISCLGFRK